MLRDPVQAALNEILVACEAAEIEHNRAADLLGDHAEADLFRDIARRRGAAAALFRAEVVQHGDLPREPNQEQELIREGLTQLKALLAHDAVRAVARDQAQVERRLREACHAAPAQTDAQARKHVDALCADAEATEKQLMALAGE